MIQESLAGSWSLVAYEELDPDGRVDLPLGEDPVGVILYAADGRMSAQIMNRAWSPGTANRADAYFVAYSGPYVVDEDASTVAHRIEVSAIASWLGTVQQRAIRLEHDVLILSSTEPVRTTSGMRMVRLTWNRFAGPDPIAVPQSRP